MLNPLDSVPEGIECLYYICGGRKYRLLGHMNLQMYSETECDWIQSECSPFLIWENCRKYPETSKEYTRDEFFLECI
jgi:hypothetical protein